MTCTTGLYDKLNASSFNRFFSPVTACRSRPPQDWASTAILYIRSSPSIDWMTANRAAPAKCPIHWALTDAMVTLMTLTSMEVLRNQANLTQSPEIWVVDEKQHEDCFLSRKQIQFASRSNRAD